MALVAEYSFNEGSGSSAADSSGNGHTLTGSGWAASAKNGAGAGQAASWVASTSGIGPSSAPAFTFMAWVKLSLPAPSDYVGILTSANTTPNGRWFEVSASGGALLLDFYHGTGTLSATSTFSVSTATHVSVVVGGGSTTLYLNGVAAGTTGVQNGSDLSNTDWTVGNGNGGVAPPGSGDWIDEIRVFDTALTSGQITTWMGTAIGGAIPLQWVQGINS